MKSVFPAAESPALRFLRRRTEPKQMTRDKVRRRIPPAQQMRLQLRPQIRMVDHPEIRAELSLPGSLTEAQPTLSTTDPQTQQPMGIHPVRSVPLQRAIPVQSGTMGQPPLAEMELQLPFTTAMA
jgi:hypothetical protein